MSAPTLEELLGAAQARRTKRIRGVTLFRDFDGRWQGSVTYDGGQGAWHVGVHADPIEALRTALAGNEEQPAPAKGIFRLMTSQGQISNRFYYTPSATNSDKYAIHDRTGRYASCGRGTIMCSGVSLDTAERIVKALNADEKLNRNRQETEAVERRRRALAEAPYEVVALGEE
jgi:hypothetical protein